MPPSFADSRWANHCEPNIGLSDTSGHLSHVRDARRCTVQLSTGRLYLDAVASNATSLLGHDTPPAVGNAPAAHQLLSSLESGYTCAATTQSFSGAAKLAAKMIRMSGASRDKVVEVNALDGESQGDCGFLIAHENETLGRSGRWCASAAWRRAPELIVIGEAIALGASFGAVLQRNDPGGNFATVRQPMDEDRADSATLARAAAVITAVEDGELLRHGCQLGDYLFERLAAVQATCPEIEGIERNGLSFRITLAPPWTAALARRRMCERGVLAGVDASHRLVLDPPLPLRIAEADVITGALRGALLGLPLLGASVCCPACDIRE